MYKHLLVPIDDSTLSTTLVTQAVRYASEANAKITFFHVARDFLATSDGALMHVMAPEIACEKLTGDAHVILNKAKAAALSAHVEADAVFKVSDNICQAIIDAAQEKACDLIYTMMRGPVSVGTLSLGSQTFRLVAHSPIPVLIAAVARNSPTPEMDKAIAIIEDEHRSLAAVLHTAKQLLDESEADGSQPDFGVLDLVVFYIKKFPEAQHHPKEDLYLFDCLRKRTHEVDEVLALLQQHHVDCTLLNELTQALAAYKGGQADARSRFALALDAFCKAEFQHMTVEERTILPVARKHLERADWIQIAAAFSENNTPGPDNVTDSLFKGIFSRLMRDASPADRLAPALAG